MNSSISDILGTDDDIETFTDAEIKALRAHWGRLDETEGLDEEAKRIYEVLEYDAVIETAGDVVADLEAFQERLESADRGIVPEEIAIKVARLVGVPASLVELVFEVTDRFCNVCVEMSDDGDT